MTATAELTLANVTVEEVGPACKRLSIELSADTVDSRFQDSMQDFVTQASLPGFRPGKAPRKLIERKFGQSLRDDTKQKLVSEAYQKAIADEELKVLGNPILENEEGIELESGKPMTFSFEVEIFPDFEIPSLDDLEIRRPLVEATDDLVDTEITNQCERHGAMQPLEEGTKPGPGHFFFGKVTIYNLDDNPLESVATNPRAITRWPDADSDGSGALGGVRVDNVAELLEGKSTGDVVTVETVGSDNHEIAEIRGKKIKIDFTIEENGQLILATPEELATKLGCADEADLRSRIKDALGAQIETEQREVMHRQVALFLLDKVEFDLPGRATASQAERVLQNARLDMIRRSVPEYVIEERLAELRESSDDQAKRDLKIHFIMERLAADNNVEVEEAEVNARIFQIARESGQRPDKVRDQIIQSNSVNVLLTQIRHEKAADRVVEGVDVKEVTVDEWNELMAGEDDESDIKPAAEEKKSTTSKKKTTKKKTTKKKTSKKKDD